MNRAHGNKRNGFTLVELMVVLAIAAIILTTAVPAYQRYIQNNRMTTGVHRLVASFNLARNEASSRGNQVTVCKSVDLINCSAGNTIGWHQGWIIFNDTNGNNTRQAPGEELIRAMSALPGNDQQIFADNGLANFVSYSASGTVSSAGALVLCDKRGYAGNATAVIVSATGSVRSGQADDPQFQPDISGATVSAATSGCG